jgi:hypothetical protein
MAFIEIRHGVPDAYVCAVGTLILTLCAGQFEFGKNLARRPAVGERSYTNSLGYLPTWLLTVGSGPLAVVLFAVAAHVSPVSKAFVALPAIGVAAFGITYLSRKDNRWPAAVSALGLLATLGAFAVVGAVG